MRAKITIISILVLLFVFGLSTFAQSLDQLMKKGDEYYKEFNHKKALETYLKADSLYPADWVLMWKISRAYVDIAEKLPQETDEEEAKKEAMFKKALFYADSSVKLAPDEAETYVRRAIANGKIALFEGIFSAIGTVNDVRDDTEHAIELGNGGNYTQALAHYILGRAHLKVCEKPYLLRLPLGLGWGDMDDAIRELETATKLRPNFRMFYIELAKAYIEEDEYEKAKETLLKVEKAPFVDEDDNALLEESKELLEKVNEELE
ncbi:tetratricopeptide repeat protein [bacterium BMS3Abin03]|jgi:tetratricopeptide (TPR) repeat protein|nr:tetratricopeptide repeat protein [bacterium BMS3Abin03]MCG6958641.1 tetratricopeptide repeat protein [bacterium BMS3Abin03]